MNYLLKGASSNPLYAEMQELSIASFKRYLAGEWELLLMNFEESDEAMPALGIWHRAYKAFFDQIHRLWQEGHNVFASDADTFCVQPIEIFGNSDSMRLYWDTAAPVPDGRWPRYLNAGPMYLPASMKPETWAVGLREIANLRADWDHIQIILNDMFWSQHPVPELDPTMNYSPHVQNPAKPEDVKIWHFHASRDREGTLERMREMSKQTVNA